MKNNHNEMQQSNYSETIFDSIKHIDANGREFWYARELQSVLEYRQWRRFDNVIQKAVISCEGSNNPVSEHFAKVGKTSPMPNGGAKILDDYQLSRYACYLIVQNGDPRKQVIALGQTYFAIQTRKQEFIEHYDDLSEDSKRIAIRGELTKHNKSLAEAAQHAGVNSPRDYAIFQNRGYQGLYGGLGVKEIHAKKGVNENSNKDSANRTHYEVGAKVRQTIKELGGTMPEDLPTSSKSIKQIERSQRS